MSCDLSAAISSGTNPPVTKRQGKPRDHSEEFSWGDSLWDEIGISARNLGGGAWRPVGLFLSPQEVLKGAGGSSQEGGVEGDSPWSLDSFAEADVRSF